MNSIIWWLRRFLGLRTSCYRCRFKFIYGAYNRRAYCGCPKDQVW
jgi:hypothetical protein